MKKLYSESSLYLFRYRGFKKFFKDAIIPNGLVIGLFYTGSNFATREIWSSPLRMVFSFAQAAQDFLY